MIVDECCVLKITPNFSFARRDVLHYCEVGVSSFVAKKRSDGGMALQGREQVESTETNRSSLRPKTISAKPDSQD